MTKNNFVKRLRSSNDIEYNLWEYGDKYNILFITWLVWSGKSTLAKELAKKYNATVITQDYLAWSDCNHTKECIFFVKLFQSLYPETKIYFKNNSFRNGTLSSKQYADYRKKFDKMVVDYIKNKRNKNFIYEGSDLFCTSDANLIINNPIIIKRTSAITSYIRSFKRGNINNNTIKEKINYIKRMIWEFNFFYIKDLPKLNNFIRILKIYKDY